MKYEDMQNELIRLAQLAEDADKARRGTNWGIGTANLTFSGCIGLLLSISVGNHDIKIKGEMTPEEAFRQADRELLRYANNDRFLAETLGIAV